MFGPPFLFWSSNLAPAIILYLSCVKLNNKEIAIETWHFPLAITPLNCDT